MSLSSRYVSTFEVPLGLSTHHSLYDPYSCVGSSPDRGCGSLMGILCLRLCHEHLRYRGDSPSLRLLIFIDVSLRTTGTFPKGSPIVSILVSGEILIVVCLLTYSDILSYLLMQYFCCWWLMSYSLYSWLLISVPYSLSTNQCLQRYYVYCAWNDNLITNLLPISVLSNWRSVGEIGPCGMLCVR